jgi:dTMP kinase
VLLDIPVSTAQQLIARKAARDYTDKAADLQEADADYLQRVRNVYLQLAEQDDRWVRISGVRDGEIRPIDEIAAEVAHVVRDLPPET